MAVLFNSIPGSGLVAPLTAFELNSAGAFTGNSRALVIGHTTTAGTLAADTPTFLGSQQDADRLTGSGSMAREMFRLVRQNAPVQEVWGTAPAETGAAATWTLTVAAAAVGTAGAAYLDIMGERISLSISAVDTTTTIAAALAAAINAYYNPLTGASLQVTAAAAVAVVTATFRHKGTIGNDTDFFIPPISGNIFALTGALTVAVGVAGTGVPTLTNSLAAMLDNQYDMVVCPWSDTASLATCIAAMNDTSGRWSYSRQSYGHVFTVAEGTTSALTTLGLTYNDRHLTVIGRPVVAPQPAYLWAAGFVGRVAPWLGDYTNGGVSRNQSNLIVQGLQPPRDRTSWYGYAVRNTLVQSGISTWTGDDFGNLCIDKLVTTNRVGPSAAPDLTFRDVQTLFQSMHSLRRLRADVNAAHGNKGLVQKNPSGNPALVAPADIWGTMVGSLYGLSDAGILKNPDQMAAALRVEIDASTPTRVNTFLALDNVHPLDVIAANATLYALGVPKAA
ncbi:hypothetical protein EYW49_20570 [Siculibacillus lacustris]|uniref:Tail sheath protein subtilisin-like domain-containing protein n=1 Tax=Siculibacillus lacustris TaxID=1549641 RepID=A0A4Q9VG22_9HYPH|nr:phage tail sheath subtilisin-like domain-containing protein [Siculibacillus lacustris]TBW33356.1 hypothetical protein EYW49_20570 [Siculibacillus lacustris]